MRDHTKERENFVILYDGVCALCNGLVRFVLRFDRSGKFRFAALQGDYARETLSRHRRDPLDVDTVVLVAKDEEGKEQILSKSGAVLSTLERLGSLFRLVAAVFRPWPTKYLDRVYDTVAKSRYRVFGKLDSCPMPDPRYSDRFIESRHDPKQPEMER